MTKNKIEYSRALAKYEWFIDGMYIWVINQRCNQLDYKNKCKMYKTRPAVCRGFPEFLPEKSAFQCFCKIFRDGIESPTLPWLGGVKYEKTRIW